MKKIRIIGILILVLVGLSLLSIFLYNIYLYYNIFSNPIINSVNLNEENKLVIQYSLDKEKFKNKVYYLVKNDNEKPKNDDNWVLSTSNKILIDLERNVYYVYLKNENNKIFKVNSTDEIGKITSIKINKEKVYVAVNGTYTVSVSFDGIGKINEEIKWYSEDDSIAKVDQNGKITGIKKGTK